MRSISGREMVSILRRHGWEVVRIQGSHHMLRRTGRMDSPTLAVPVHGNADLKIGLARKLLKSADIDPESI